MPVRARGPARSPSKLREQIESAAEASAEGRAQSSSSRGGKQVSVNTQHEHSALISRLDRERYTHPASIFAALETGSVRLVKSSWLIAQWKAGRILHRRQETPEAAFITVTELKALFGEGNKDGVLPIIAVSFCWLTAAHPDPEGQQLALVAAALEREQANYKKQIGAAKGFEEMGVFWDWLSICQKDPSLFDGSQTPDAVPKAEKPAFIKALSARRKFFGGEAYEMSRNAEEKALFAHALHETMDLWYAHQGTTVYMLTKLPEGSTRRSGYGDSGWTTYERCSAEQIKKFFLLRAEWKLVLDLGAAAGEEGQRSWPIGPDDFDKLIATKAFTNGADTQVVQSLFRKMSTGQLGGITALNFEGMRPPTLEDARHLSGCLNLCVSLESLVLNGVGLDNATCRVIFSNLVEGALPALKSLGLISITARRIADSGAGAIADACEMGAMAKLALLQLEGNDISEALLKRLRAVMVKRNGKVRF